MDGDAKALRENEDVKEFYLGIAEGKRKSFRDVQALQAAQALAGVDVWLVAPASRARARRRLATTRRLMRSWSAEPRPKRAELLRRRSAGIDDPTTTTLSKPAIPPQRERELFARLPDMSRAR